MAQDKKVVVHCFVRTAALHTTPINLRFFILIASAQCGYNSSKSFQAHETNDLGHII